jgi:hypothetical protein
MTQTLYAHMNNRKILKKLNVSWKTMKTAYEIIGKILQDNGLEKNV